MHKRITVFLLGLLACLFLLETGLTLLGLSSRLGQTLRNRRPRALSENALTVTCMGESITYGSYPPQLAAAVKTAGARDCRVLDRAMLASDSNYIASALPRILVKDTPDIVLVMTGINDDKDPDLFRRIERPFSFRRLRTYRLFRFLAPLLGHSGLRRRGEDKVWPLEHSIPDLGAVMARVRSGKATAYDLRRALGFVLRENKLPRAEKLWNVMRVKFPDEFNDSYFLTLAARILIGLKKYAAAKELALGFMRRRPEDFTGPLVYAIAQNRFPEGEADFLARKDPELARILGPRIAQSKDRTLNEDFFHDIICVLEDSGREREAMSLARQCRTAWPMSALMTHAFARVCQNTGSHAELEALLKDKETLDIFGRAWAVTGLAACLEAQGKTDEAAAALAAAESAASGALSPATVRNCRTVIEQVRAAGRTVVFLSYPTLSVSSLKAALGPAAKDVFFVDNGAVFRQAVAKDGYKRFFTDMYGGSFGHLTDDGSALAARNIAQALLKLGLLPGKDKDAVSA